MIYIVAFLCLAFSIAGLISIILVAPYKPRYAIDYFGLVFRHIGITSLVVLFATLFAIGLVILFGG